MANGFKQHTVYDIDPKTFFKPAPRAPQPLEVAMEVPKPLFSQRSLADFDESHETVSGKTSTHTQGRLETFLEVINIGASTGTLRHPQLSKTVTVLEGYVYYKRKTGHKDYELDEKLEPGSFVVCHPHRDYEFYTVDTFVVLAVTQEAYYDLELLGGGNSKKGIAPAFGSHLPPRERVHTKAVEQSLAMAEAENRRQLDIEQGNVQAHVNDFNPLDERWNGVNAQPYLPPIEE